MKKCLIAFLKIIPKGLLFKILISYTMRSLFYFNNNKNKSTNKTLLVLNHSRFIMDLEPISKDGRVNLLILPSKIQTRINSLFLNLSISYEAENYLRNNEECINLVSFINKMIGSINRKYNLCGIFTCSFYYKQDYPYMFSSVKGVPFYTLFKEYMIDEIQVSRTIERYKERRYKFNGDTLFLANNTVKKVLVKASVCNEAQTKIVGSPRFDEIFKTDKSFLKEKRNSIILFSFFHCSGLVELKGKNNFWTTDENDGFFKLFRDVHVAFVELARENREINFIIKTKFGSHWHDQIKNTIFHEMGINLENEKNIQLVCEESAQSLIKRSSIVVAFNSTTVLESLAMGVDVVIPIFHEAQEKYFKTNVMFTKYFKYLNIASSKNQLINKVLRGHTAQSQNYILPDQMVKDFIAYTDGLSAERIINKVVSIK